MCYARLVDLDWYSDELQDIANIEVVDDSGGGAYLRILSKLGSAVELSPCGFSLRVDYFKKDMKSVAWSKVYESRIDVLYEIRYWFSDGIA